MANKDELSAGILFGLPPDKAIEYLQSKGYIITRNWMDLWKEANAKAFTVAGVLKEDILKDLKETITKTVKQGGTYEDFQKNIEPIMQSKGWYLNNSRLKIIYTQNMDIAYSVGRYQEQMAVIDFMPYWQYSAIMDMKTRPEHAALNGKVFKADDPFWNYFYPPNGFNCRCRVITYTEKQFNRKDLELSTTNNGNDINEVSVEVGRGSSRKLVTTHSWQGNKIDVGWDYNPGKEYFAK